MSRLSLVALLLLAGLGWVRPSAAQMPIEDWTERPDARAPAGVNEDALLAPGAFEARYSVEVVAFEGLKVGTDEIPAVLVLRDWDLAPLTMTTQRHEVEVRAGIFDWLGASATLPFQYTSTEFVDEQFRGNPTASGIGDVELHGLIGLHDIWPYRAHLIAGLSLPTGSIEKVGQLPNGAVGGPDRTLPYPMQPGDGTFAFLPGAVLVAENEFGTVGFRAEARIPIGENDRGWTRGNAFIGQVWMAHRFTDWVSGSARVSFQKVGDLTGADGSVDAFSSPLAHPDLQGGTRVEIPIGINLRFPEGRLQKNRIHFEFIVPVHQDLDGPQLTPSSGVAVSWSYAF